MLVHQLGLYAATRRQLFAELDRCNRANDVPQALRVLRALEVSGGDAKAASSSFERREGVPMGRYLQVLSMCARPGHLTEFQRLRADMVSRFGEDAVFSAASDIHIRVLAENDRRAEAVALHRSMRRRGMRLKRRSYGPVLSAACRARDEKTAFELYGEARAQGIRFRGAELADLVEMCLARGLEDRMRALVGDVETTSSIVSPRLLSALRAWFQSRGYRAYDELNADVKGGLGASCGLSLVPQALGSAQIDRYLDRILAYEIANQSSRRKLKTTQKSIKKFISKLSRDGPSQVWIDGANIGHFEMGGSFSYQQVAAVSSHFSRAGMRTRVVLHQSRVQGLPSGSPESAIVQRWIAGGMLYVTPNGVNDDSYWLYGALWSSKHIRDVLVVTNDLLRDHIFHLRLDRDFNDFLQAHTVQISLPDAKATATANAGCDSRPRSPCLSRLRLPPRGPAGKSRRKRRKNKRRPAKNAKQVNAAHFRAKSAALACNRPFSPSSTSKSTQGDSVEAAATDAPLPTQFAPGARSLVIRQPPPLERMPVPASKAGWFIAPGVIDMCFHFPKRYAIRPQRGPASAEGAGAVFFVPYISGAVKEDILDDDNGVVIPVSVASQVRWAAFVPPVC